MSSAVSTGGGPSSWRWAKRWVVDPAGCCSPIRRATASSSTSGPRTTRTASQAVRRSSPSTCTNTLITWTTARRQPSTSMRSWRTSVGATWRHCTRYSRRPGENTFAKEPTMSFSSLIAAIVAAVLSFVPLTARAQSDADWKAVEQALGKSGQMMPGDVFRIAMPRTDLKVKVQGVDVKAGFALGSYAAFKKTGKDAMVMGDLVLLDEEVNDVMTRLLDKGIAVTALHNHLNEMSPHVMYMHYSGHGDAVQLAASLREALSASKTPLGA